MSSKRKASEVIDLTKNEEQPWDFLFEYEHIRARMRECVFKLLKTEFSLDALAKMERTQLRAIFHEYTDGIQFPLTDINKWAEENLKECVICYEIIQHQPCTHTGCDCRYDAHKTCLQDYLQQSPSKKCLMCDASITIQN